MARGSRNNRDRLQAILNQSRARAAPMGPVNPLNNLERPRALGQANDIALNNARAQAYIDREAGMNVVPFGLGRVAQPFADFATPEGRAALGRRADDVGDWLSGIGQDVGQYFSSGDALEDVQSIPERVPAALANLATAPVRAGMRYAERNPNALGNALDATGSVMRAGAGAFADDPLAFLRAPEDARAALGGLAAEYGPGIVDEALIAPGRRVGEAAVDAQALAGLGDQEGAQQRLYEAAPDLGWHALNTVGGTAFDAGDLMRVGQGVARGFGDDVLRAVRVPDDAPFLIEGPLPVEIGQQLNRDGSVSPRSPIDWDAPISLERSSMRDLGVGRGQSAVDVAGRPRGNAPPAGEGQSARTFANDDFLRQIQGGDRGAEERFFAPTGFDGRRRTNNRLPDERATLPPGMVDGSNPAYVRNLGNDPFDDEVMGAMGGGSEPSAYDLALARQQGSDPDGARTDVIVDRWIESFTYAHGRPPETTAELDEYVTLIRAIERRAGETPPPATRFSPQEQARQRWGVDPLARNPSTQTTDPLSRMGGRRGVNDSPDPHGEGQSLDTSDLPPLSRPTRASPIDGVGGNRPPPSEPPPPEEGGARPGRGNGVPEALLGLGGAALLAGDSEAQEAPEQDQDGRALDAAIAEVQSNIDEIDGRLEVLENVDASNPDSVMAAQRILGVEVDGRIGPQTSPAIERRIAQLRADREPLVARLETLEADASAQRVSPSAASIVLREGAGVGGVLAGIGGALLARKLGVNATNNLVRGDPLPSLRRNASQAAVEARNAMAAEQMGGVNEFARLGGAGRNVPFAPDPQSPLGYSPRPNPREASELYSPIQRAFDPLTIAGVVGGGAESWLMGALLEDTREKLAEAEAFLRANQESDAARIEVERLRDLEAVYLGLMRVGQGAMLGTATGALKLRPDVAAYEGQVARLNQLSAPRLSHPTGSPIAPIAPPSPPAPRTGGRGRRRPTGQSEP